MLSSLRRISDRIASEASAWLGAREKLAFKVVRTVNGNDLKQYFDDFPDPHVMLRRVLPNGLSSQLIEAVQNGRRILCLFLIDQKRAIGDEYVITIDLERRRVDRKLSSWQLLADPWSRVHVPLPSQTTKEVERYPKIDWFVFMLTFPIQEGYRRMFLVRQQDIEHAFGFSRRFQSLAACLDPQLDTETRVRLRAALHHLWEHERRMERVVDFEEAKQVLSTAHMTVTCIDYDFDLWEMHDPGPTIESCRWIDAEGNLIASAEKFGDHKDRTITSIRMCVLRTIFYNNEAEQLYACFHRQTVIDHRKKDKPSPPPA